MLDKLTSVAKIGNLFQQIKCKNGGTFGRYKVMSAPMYDIFTSHAITLLHFVRLDALALSVIATATWLAGWVAVCHPVLYQND